MSKSNYTKLPADLRDRALEILAKIIAEAGTSPSDCGRYTDIGASRFSALLKVGNDVNPALDMLNRMGSAVDTSFHLELIVDHNGKRTRISMEKGDKDNA